MTHAWFSRSFAHSPRLDGLARRAAQLFSVLAVASLAACASLQAPGARPPAAPAFNVEVAYHTLDNGLKVVLAPDATVPTATVGVYYGIGFRIEPRERTGFAHLFEHLMFQGSANAPKGDFDTIIYNAGGVNNGSTRFDFTNYYEVVPSNALETVLWLEADRMAFPVIDQEVLDNQRGVVINEVKVNVLNQPYGGWPWIDMPMLANENWHNAHNFYGDLTDLEAATVEDAQAFFGAFYRPSNAVLVIAGDFEPATALGWVETYFGAIPGGDPVVLPDISEPRQEAAKFKVKPDALAPRPAYSAAYHIPERNTPAYFAMAMLDQLLLQGEDSLLHQKLVNEKGFAGDVFGGVNLLGNLYNYDGPMLWTFGLIHDAEHDADAITSAVDEVITQITTDLVSDADLARARTKLRSQFYDIVDTGTRFGLVDLLASFALFDDDPARINALEAEFDAVTPELMREVAIEYLRPTNRSILVVEPQADASAEETDQ